MGQGQSSRGGDAQDASHFAFTADAEQKTDHTNEPGAEERADTFTLWPGLDHQLELAFHSLDLDETGLLPYSTLEPVLRHQLMQIGLIEYVTRFALPDGRLDENVVRHYLDAFRVDLNRELNIIDWKNLMLAWIRRVQDAQYEDIDRWQKSVASMQEAQAREYQVLCA